MSKEPKRNVYVGHRYVPKIMGEWDKTETYEGLSIVTNKGTSYTSKKRVPKGIDILNEEYWVVTGNYDAQIEDYREEVRNVQLDIINLGDELNNDLNNFEQETNTKISNIEKKTGTDLSELKQNVNSKIDLIDQDLYNVSPYHPIEYKQFYDKDIETTCYLTHIKRKTKKGTLNLKYKRLTGKNQTVVDYSRNNNVSVGFNAGMFGRDNNHLDYTTIENGNIVYENYREPLEYRHYLAIMEDGSLRSYPSNTSAEKLLNEGVKSATVGFTPMYEQRSKKTDLMRSYDEFNEPHPRQIIAQVENGDYYILTIGGRGVDGKGATVTDSYDVLMKNVQGVIFAFNLDGGGSSQTVIRGNMINPSYDEKDAVTGGKLRKRPDVLFIEGNKKTTKRDETLDLITEDIAQIKDDFHFLNGVQYGTWDPVLGSEDSYAEESVQYNKKNGYYVRLGNIIFAFYHIDVKNKGNGEGNIRIRNLPGGLKSKGEHLTSTVSTFNGLKNPNVFNPFMDHRANVGTILLKALRTDDGDGDDRLINEIVNVNYTSVKDSFLLIGMHAYITDANTQNI